jgi:hypothetical protein
MTDVFGGEQFREFGRLFQQFMQVAIEQSHQESEPEAGPAGDTGRRDRGPGSAQPVHLRAALTELQASRAAVTRAQADREFSPRFPASWSP